MTGAVRRAFSPTIPNACDNYYPAPEGLPRLRLALFADCAWREMEGAHGVHQPPGWPRVAAECLAERGVGLELSVVNTIGVHSLPSTPEDLVGYIKLDEPPDAVIVQTGSAHYGCRIIPGTPRVVAVTTRASIRAKGLARTLHTVKNRTYKRLLSPEFPYPGPAAYAPFLRVVAASWPDARVAAIPVLTRSDYLPRERVQEALMHSDLAATGVERIDLAPLLEPYGRSARCHNGINLNRLGSRLAGEHIAGWLLPRGEEG